MTPPVKNPNQVWRVIDMLRWGEDYFRGKGFEHPKREIEWLLCDLLDYKRIDLYVQFEQPLSSEELASLKTWIQRRLNKEPLQYITGKTEFYGRPFHITPFVLIPRPETERLIDVALHAIGNVSDPTVLEIGTGSGIIAVSLGAELPHAQIKATDVSEEAIEVAKLNAEKNGVENIEFYVSNFLSDLPDKPFDLLVSNPPYIPMEEMGSLMAEVHAHEPRIALTDEKDGLTFYYRFAEKGTDLVKPGGWMILEVGLGEHPEKVKAIFEEGKFSSVELIADFNGDDRVLKVLV